MSEEFVLQDYIEAKKVDSALETRLRALGPLALDAVSQIISVTNPSANTLREVLRLAEEISARDGVSLGAVIGDSVFLELLSADGLSRKEKQKQLKLFLHRVRYPLSAAFKDRLKACQQRLLAKTGLKLDYPDDFEGDKIKLELSFRSPEELAEYGDTLLRLGSDEDCAELFALLKGER